MRDSILRDVGVQEQYDFAKKTLMKRGKKKNKRKKKEQMVQWMKKWELFVARFVSVKERGQRVQR